MFNKDRCCYSFVELFDLEPRGSKIGQSDFDHVQRRGAKETEDANTTRIAQMLYALYGLGQSQGIKTEVASFEFD